MVIIDPALLAGFNALLTIPTRGTSVLVLVESIEEGEGPLLDVLNVYIIEKDQLGETTFGGVNHHARHYET